MKITKNQLRGWIKEVLSEIEEPEDEQEPTEEPSEEEPSQVDTLDLEDNPFKKAEKNEGKLTESKLRRFTVKEVQKWMKTLEENRYRKLVNADARRVSWFVNNNMSEDYETMPKSMAKKWDKAKYGKERYLAREFIKHKRNEEKLRESIRNIIRFKIRG